MSYGFSLSRASDKGVPALGWAYLVTWGGIWVVAVIVVAAAGGLAVLATASTSQNSHSLGCVPRRPPGVASLACQTSAGRMAAVFEWTTAQ